MNKIITSFVILLFCSITYADITVTDSHIAKDIKDLEQIGENVVFNKNVGTLYCLTTVETDNFPTYIIHLWLYNNKIMAKVPLSINGKKWRTYSSKKILPKNTGQWKVEVYSEDGKLIHTIPFKINNGETK